MSIHEDKKMVQKQTDRETYFKSIKAILMGVGESDNVSTAMANSILMDEDLSLSQALRVAEAYAESKRSSKQ